jgi:glycosyltransferase involved in cell wall biosynthesis
MTGQKNQRAILEAAHQLKQDSSLGDLHFIIAGSGPLAEELKAKAVQLQIEDNILFTGYLPEREHIYKLLHESDIFVTPSEYEGFCVAAVEAMACRLPVIASELDVFREVIGDHGSFVPSSNNTILANRIKEYSNNLDNQSINERRDNLYERAVTKFPIEKTAKKYHNLYVDLLE